MTERIGTEIWVIAVHRFFEVAIGIAVGQSTAALKVSAQFGTKEHHVTAANATHDQPGSRNA